MVNINMLVLLLNWTDAAFNVFEVSLESHILLPVTSIYSRRFFLSSTCMPPTCYTILIIISTFQWTCNIICFVYLSCSQMRTLLAGMSSLFWIVNFILYVPSLNTCILFICDAHNTRHLFFLCVDKSQASDWRNIPNDIILYITRWKAEENQSVPHLRSFVGLPIKCFQTYDGCRQQPAANPGAHQSQQSHMMYQQPHQVVISVWFFHVPLIQEINVVSKIGWLFSSNF